MHGEKRGFSGRAWLSLQYNRVQYLCALGYGVDSVRGFRVGLVGWVEEMVEEFIEGQ
jgi:hypothetical protein